MRQDCFVDPFTIDSVHRNGETFSFVVDFDEELRCSEVFNFLFGKSLGFNFFAGIWIVEIGSAVAFLFG